MISSPAVDIILRVATPVGVLRSTRRPDWSVVVVKVTYELDADALLAPSCLAPEQEPLSDGEERSWGGTLGGPLPSDFVEDKSLCDVVLVGAALQWPGSVRLRVNEVERTVSHAGMLGPLREATDAQIAPPDQRMQPLTSAAPLQITVEGGGGRLDTMLRVPFPNVALVDETISSVSAVPIQADTLLLDPVERTLSIVFRGSFSSPEDLDLSLALVVDTLGLLARTPPRELKRWPRMEAVESDGIDLDDADMEITRGGTVNVVRLATQKARLLDETRPPTTASGLVRRTRTIRMTTADVEIARLPPPPAPPPPSTAPSSATALIPHQTLPALPLWAPAPPSETLHDATLAPATLPRPAHAAPLLVQEDTHSETRFVLEAEAMPKLEATSNLPVLDVTLPEQPRPPEYTPSPHSARTRPMSSHAIDAALKALFNPPEAPAEAPIESPPEKQPSAPPPSLELSPLHSMPTVEMSVPARSMVDAPPDSLMGPTLGSNEPAKK